MLVSFLIKSIALLFALMAGVGMQESNAHWNGRWTDTDSGALFCLIVSIIFLFFA